MRFATLSLILSSLLVSSSVAVAQSEATDQPTPPSPSRQLPQTVEPAAPAMMGAPIPSWQMPPGGYGGWYGGNGHGYCCDNVWSNYCSGGCGHCNQCGGHCRRKQLACKMKSFKNRLLSCFKRSSCSCCAPTSCSCCGGGASMTTETEPLGAPAADQVAPPQDLLPMPPPETAPYDASSSNEQASASEPLVKKQYTMPHMTSSRKHKVHR